MIGKLVLIVTLILIYYNYIKQYIIACTPKLVKTLHLTRYFPAEDIKGAIELLLIASSHVMFAMVLLKILPIQLPFYALSTFEIIVFSLSGILLGIGCMGVAGLYCKFAIMCIDTMNLKQSRDIKTWLTIGRGGWIKHHLQSLEIFPAILSILILTMQVGSEEVIFRGIIYHYFLNDGFFTASFLSISLFVFMQIFLMQSWYAAIFPIIGALIIGVVHTILYVQVPLLFPLIISHVTFFLFSVL